MAYPYRYGQHLHAQHTHLATPPPPQNIPLPPSRAGSVMSSYSRSGSYTPQPQASPYRSTSGSYAYQPSRLGEGRSPSRLQAAKDAYDTIIDQQTSSASSRSTYSRYAASSGSVYSQATASSHGQQRYHQYPAPPVPPLNIHHRNSPPLPSAGPEIIAPVPRYPRTSSRAPSLLSRHDEPPSSDSESEYEEVMSHMSRSTRSSQRPRASSPTPTSRTAVSRHTNASVKSAGSVSTVKRVQSTPSFVSGRLYFVPDASAPPVPGIPVTMTPVSNYSTIPSGYATPTPGYAGSVASSATSVMTSAPSYTATPNQFAHPPFAGYVPPSVPQAYPVTPGMPGRNRTITSTATFVDNGRGSVRKVSEYIDYEPKAKKGLLGKLFKS